MVSDIDFPGFDFSDSYFSVPASTNNSTRQDGEGGRLSVHFSQFPFALFAEQKRSAFDTYAHLGRVARKLR